MSRGAVFRRLTTRPRRHRWPAAAVAGGAITPPTKVADYQTVFNTGTWPKTVSVTTAVGDVLVAAVSIDEWGSAADDVATPTGGTGLTWIPLQSQQTALNSAVWVYGAVATTAETFTFSVALNGGAATGGADITRWSGSDGIGTTAESQQAAGNAPSCDLATANDNSAIVAWFVDWSETSPAGHTWRTINSITPASGSGELYAIDVAGHAVFYGAVWGDAGTAGTKTTGLTTPTMKPTGAAVEVRGHATGGAGSSWVPPHTRARARARGPQRRGHYFTVTPTPAAPTPPAWVSAIVSSRRTPRPTRRDGQLWPLPPAAQVPTPPAWVAKIVTTRRIRPPATARRPVLWTPPQAAAATPPTYPTQWITRRRPVTVPTARGVFLATPTQPTAGSWPSRSYRRPPTPRRGKFTNTVPAQAVQTPPPYPPQWIRPSTRRPAATRRADLAQVVPAQVAQTPPPYPPQWLRTGTRRPAQTRHGHLTPFTPDQVTQAPPTYPPQWMRTTIRRATPTRRGDIYPTPVIAVVAAAPAWPPPIILRRRRPTTGLRRRGSYYPSPAAPATPPPAYLRRRPPAAPPRRRGMHLPRPYPQITTTPPPYPPQWIRRPDRRFARTRRTVRLPLYLVGAAYVPITIGIDGAGGGTSQDGNTTASSYDGAGGGSIYDGSATPGTNIDGTAATTGNVG